MREQAGGLAQTMASFKLSQADAMHSDRSPAVVERRGSNRATNVTRLGAAAKPAAKPAPAARPQRQAAAATGTDGDWEQF